MEFLGYSLISFGVFMAILKLSGKSGKDGTGA
jgi:hypothetical protein